MYGDFILGDLCLEWIPMLIRVQFNIRIQVHFSCTASRSDTYTEVEKSSERKTWASSTCQIFVRKCNVYIFSNSHIKIFTSVRNQRTHAYVTSSNLRVVHSQEKLPWSKGLVLVMKWLIPPNRILNYKWPSDRSL